MSRRPGSVLSLISFACLLTAVAVLSPVAASAANAKLDKTFTNPRVKPNPVRAIVPLPNGKVLIAGSFAKVGGEAYSGVARLNADGTVDTSFHNREINARVNAMVRLPSGKIVIGGDFTSVGGLPYGHLARLKQNGGLDRTFSDPKANNGIWALSALSHDRFLAAGGFTGIDGTSRARLARINSSGHVDTTFNDPGVGCCTVFTVAQTTKGKVLIGGEFSTVSGQPRIRIAQLRRNGSLDPSFIPSDFQDGSVESIAVLPNGKLVAGGGFSTVGGQPYLHVVRLTATGSIDLGFRNPQVGVIGHLDNVNQVVALANGKLVVAGEFDSVRGRSYGNLVQLNSNGTLTRSFPNFGINGEIKSIAVGDASATGHVFIGGLFTKVSGKRYGGMAKLSGADL